MLAWNHLVATLAALLCTLSETYGGNLGWAIITIRDRPAGDAAR